MTISNQASGIRPGVCSSTTRPTAPYNGQLIYETDTRKVYIYNGTSWVEQPTAGMVDAKGDLLVGTAADTAARLAVGTDGHALIADSSATNGLSYAPLTGFRNAIINGDFSVNQRKLNSSGQVDGVALTTNQYGQDRWIVEMAGGTVTYSAQTFTVGNPITGQEPANFAQMAISGQTLSGSYAIFEQRIESVRTFAGQTITISFWAKATSGTPAVAVEIGQYFGTGGSPSAAVNTAVGKVTLSTSWARYQVSVAVPSISGKTLGTNNDHSLQIYLWCSAGSNFNSRTNSLGLQNSTLQFWGVQVEAGSVATVFERRPQQTELDLCQRYYWRFGGDVVYQYFAMGQSTTTSAARVYFQHPVPMRANPHTLDFSTLAIDDSSSITAVTGLTIGWNAKNMTRLDATTAAVLVANRAVALVTNNSLSAYLGLSAELTA